MNVRYSYTPERMAAIEAALPKEKITETMILPALAKATNRLLLPALLAEIEAYKAYPKQGKMDTKSFEPRNHKTCFMGQAFRVKNNTLSDGDLTEYRKRIGTIPHARWGACTLLEIWAGDHMKNHAKMVTEVFRYCKGERDTLPKVRFYVMPLFANKHSGEFIHDEDDKQAQKDQFYHEVVTQRLAAGRKHPNKMSDKQYKEFIENFEKEFEIQWKRGINDANS